MMTIGQFAFLLSVAFQS